MLHDIDGFPMPWRIEEMTASGEILQPLGRFAYAYIAMAAWRAATDGSEPLLSNCRLRLRERSRVVATHNC